MYGLISPLMAQSAATVPAGAGAGFDFKSLLLPVLLIAVFYFLILRPQQKRMKQQREMLSNLRRGDKVLTAGGVIGTISRIDNDREIQVEIAPNVVIRLARSGITEVLGSTTDSKTEMVPPSGQATTNVTPLKKPTASSKLSKTGAKASSSAKTRSSKKPS